MASLRLFLLHGEHSSDIRARNRGHTQTHALTRTHKRTYVHTTHTLVHTHTRAHARTHTRTHAHARTQAHPHTHAHNTYCFLMWCIVSCCQYSFAHDRGVWISHHDRNTRHPPKRVSAHSIHAMLCNKFYVIYIKKPLRPAHFYSQLDSTVSTVVSRDACVVLGDFNAKTGSGWRASPDNIGRFGKGHVC